MKRRQFVGHLAAGSAVLALAGTSFTLEGCNALTELETWVPVGLTVFDGVASIVDGVFTAVAATVDALWAAVQNAINLYQHSTDPVKTRLDKVIATLDALRDGLNQALAALPISIPAAVLAASKAALGLTIATLTAIRNKLEPAPAVIATHAAMAGAVTVPPAKSTKDYKAQINAIMAANGQAFRVK
jgi:hypothetical protein